MGIMDILPTLLLAHLVADFPLQTNWVFRMKNKHWLGIVLHVMIHLLTTAFLLREPVGMWPLLLILGVLHFTCDYTKLLYQGERQTAAFVLDQVIHLAVLIGLAAAFPTAETVLPAWILYPALLYSTAPVFLVLLAIYGMEVSNLKTTTIIRQRMYESSRSWRATFLNLQWATHSGIAYSQAIGQPLVIGLTILLMVITIM